MSGATLLVLGLAVVTFASFAWAIQQLFTLPEGKTRAIRQLSGAASLCAVVHIATLGFLPGRNFALTSLGIVLYLLALGVFWWAVTTVRTRPLSFAFSGDVPEHLVVSGPYRWVRHPFYLAYLLAWGAGVVATQSLWLIPTLVGMYGLYLRAARLEEVKFATSPFARAYATYATHTGAFFPRFRSR